MISGAQKGETLVSYIHLQFPSVMLIGLETGPGVLVGKTRVSTDVENVVSTGPQGLTHEPEPESHVVPSVSLVSPKDELETMGVHELSQMPEPVL